MSRFRPLSEAVVLARPFLSRTRDELTAYLNRLGQPWRVDSSNDSPDLLRNRIRHELVPLLRDMFPGKAESSVLKLASHASRMKEFLEMRLDEALGTDGEGFSADAAGRVTLTAELLARIDPFLLPVLFRRLWRRQGWPMGEMDSSRWEAVTRMALGEGERRRFLPGGLTAERSAGGLLIFPAPAGEKGEN